MRICSSGLEKNGMLNLIAAVFYFCCENACVNVCVCVCVCVCVNVCTLVCFLTVFCSFV